MYLVGWLPVGIFVAGGLGQVAAGHPWTTAAVFLLPLTIVYAFVCLSAWYVCRVFPIEGGGPVWRAASVHIVAAAMTSALWVALAEAWASTLDAFLPGFGATALHRDQRSLLFLI